MQRCIDFYHDTRTCDKTKYDTSARERVSPRDVYVWVLHAYESENHDPAGRTSRTALVMTGENDGHISVFFFTRDI